jgi:hypothetical protein
MARASGWRRTVAWSFLLAVFSLSSAALNTSDPLEAYAGTWQAQFQGKTFLTINLAKQQSGLGGTVSHTNIELNNSGELTSAAAKDGEDPITDAKVGGDVLRLTSQDQQTQQATQFEMKLTGADSAELQVIGTSAPQAKPWKLQRTSAAPAALAAQNKPQDTKSKLAAAAQTWLGGQFGTGSGSSSSASSSKISTPTGGTSAAPTSATPPLKVSDSALDASLRKDIDDLPRRVRDQFNNLGDMVNFVVVGSQEQVQSALDAANWHAADTDNKEAALKAVLQTYEKKDYLTMPMSTLYLFDRPQDFGYEEAEAYSVVASRHHFRLWKAPFTWNGQTVWAGAGTHDIGFEKDVRNGNVTHKIDPAVDGERDNIGETLQKSGKVKTLSYYMPPDPVQDAKNATGGGYHSDGHVLVIILQ